MRRITTITALVLFGFLQNLVSAQSITETTASGASNSVFTVNGTVALSSAIFDTAVAHMSEGDTLWIGSISDTILVDEKNDDLSSLNIVVMLIDSGVAFWTDAHTWTLSDSSTLIMYNGGDLAATSPCSANQKLKFGKHSLASCSGGNADFSFQDIVDFGGWNPASPVPVTLTMFTHEMIGETSAKLIWQTASEINHAKFELYKSTNGIDFELVHTEYSDGVNSTTIKNYFFVDSYIGNRGAYYKLSQTDFDGKSEEFNIIRVAANENVSINTYPNPINNVLNVAIKSDKSENTVELTNTQGQVVFEKRLTKNENLSINTEHLPSGVYILKVDTKTVKLLKN